MKNVPAGSKSDGNHRDGNSQPLEVVSQKRFDLLSEQEY